MLGAFLGIGKQFCFECFVFGGGFAAWASPGEGADGGFTVIDTDHDFRRTADKVSCRSLQQEHERAGIHHSQSTVHIEWSGIRFAGQTLTDHDLENVPGTDVLAAVFDSSAEFFFSEVGAYFRVGFDGEIDISKFDISAGEGELPTKHIESFFGAGTGFFGIALAQVSQSSHEDDLANVIEDHN